MSSDREVERRIWRERWKGESVTREEKIAKAEKNVVTAAREMITASAVYDPQSESRVSHHSTRIKDGTWDPLFFAVRELAEAEKPEPRFVKSDIDDHIFDRKACVHFPWSNSLALLNKWVKE